MAFITAEDESGEAELILFPSLYSQVGERISENGIYVFVGNPELKEAYGDEESDSLTILLKSVLTPEEALRELGSKSVSDSSSAEQGAKSLYIKVTEINRHRLDDAIALAGQFSGESRILVYFEADKKLKQAKGKTTQISERLLNMLKEIMGKENVAVK